MLGDTAAAVRSDCFEPEVETMEIMVSFLHGDGCQNCSYVDVGCNMGVFAAYAAAEGARVQCFEPSAFYTESLRQTAWHYPHFAFHAAAVFGNRTAPYEITEAFLPDGRGYRPCGIGREVPTRPVPRVDLARILRSERHVDFLKIDIDSIDGLLLGTATDLLEAGEVSITTMLVELGCFHPRLQQGGGPCKWAWQGGDHSQRRPRGGDVHDLWRLQQMGYDVYRVNIHTNHEVYDWRGVDLNTRATPSNSSHYRSLHFIRAMKTLELLLPHSNSNRYGELIRRGQSVLITRVPLARVRQAQPFDVELALGMPYQSRGTQLALNRGNPALRLRGKAPKE